MRYWSLLFALAVVASIGVFVYAPFAPNWWLPNPIGASAQSVSKLGREVDRLFVLILWITGIVFIGTQLALVWVTFRYADRPGRIASYFHGSRLLELIWTIIPGAILIFISVYQMRTWADLKFRSSAPSGPPVAEVTGRQFQWTIRYPGLDGKFNTLDDLHRVNDLHFVRGKPALIHLKSADVLHSFFLPQMRVKQDAVPGLTIPVWFDSDREGAYELVCAELCGWGHYKMRGKVTVHSSQSDFDAWLSQASAEQDQSQVADADNPEGR